MPAGGQAVPGPGRGVRGPQGGARSRGGEVAVAVARIRARLGALYLEGHGDIMELERGESGHLAETPMIEVESSKVLETESVETSRSKFSNSLESQSNYKSTDVAVLERATVSYFYFSQSLIVR